MKKLRNGLLLTLPPRLIRRLKSHFHHLPPPAGPTGVDIILGLNGFVWISSGTTVAQREGGEGFDAEGVYSNTNDVSPPSIPPWLLVWCKGKLELNAVGHLARRPESYLDRRGDRYGVCKV